MGAAAVVVVGGAGEDGDESEACAGAGSVVDEGIGVEREAPFTSGF